LDNEAEICKAVVRARVRLILDEPYLAAAIAQFPIVDASDSSWCDTMATDGYRIYYNRSFAESLSASDVEFVLAHEVSHCVLGHIERRGERHPGLWNIAIDLATNLILGSCGLTVPKSALYDKKYADLTAEDIYAELKKDPGAAIKKLGLEGRFPDLETTDKNNGRDGKPPSSNDPSGGDGKSGSSGLRLFDQHIEMPPEGMSDQLARPVDSELREMRRDLLKPITDHLKSQGTLPGCWDETVKMAGEEPFPWREVLSRFMTGLRHDDYRWFPPNKKHVWRGLYLPSIGTPAPHHVAVAVDTSGSMRTRELSSILGFLDSLRKAHNAELTVIQCDAWVQDDITYEPWDDPDFKCFKFHGRGGTDFRPVFQLLQKKASAGTRFDCLIFFTDGYGPFPTQPPEFPVMWIYYGNTLRPPFGEVLKIV
jgi:predicted metal-dependent peptidase